MTKDSGYSSSGRGGRVLKTSNKALIEEITSLKNRLASDSSKRAAFEAQAARLPADRRKAAMERFNANLDKIKGDLGPRVKEMNKRGLKLPAKNETPKPVVDKPLKFTNKQTTVEVRSAADVKKIAKAGGHEPRGKVLEVSEGKMKMSVYVDYSGSKPKLVGEFNDGSERQHYQYRQQLKGQGHLIREPGGTVVFDSKGNVDSFLKRGKNGKGEITDAAKREILSETDFSPKFVAMVNRAIPQIKAKASRAKNEHFMAKLKKPNKDPRVALELLEQLTKKKSGGKKSFKDGDSVRLSAWEAKQIFGRSGMGGKNLSMAKDGTLGFVRQINFGFDWEGVGSGMTIAETIKHKGKINWE